MPDINEFEKNNTPENGIAPNNNENIFSADNINNNSAINEEYRAAAEDIPASKNVTREASNDTSNPYSSQAEQINTSSDNLGEIPNGISHTQINEGSPCCHHNESAGIRYNADKNSTEGNYTWQYCNTPNHQPSPMYHAPRKKHGILKTVLISVGCVAAIGILGIASWYAVINMKADDNKRPGDDIKIHNRPFDNTPSRPDVPVIGRDDDDNDSKAPQITLQPDENGILTKQMIAVKCKPSSVGIEVTKVTQSYFGAYKSSGVGSGFILTDDGYIATNNHVIEGADEVTVMMDDGTKYPAKVIGADSVTDLAVIKIEATGLIPMEIGDSDLMRVGDSVIAIGTPAGIEFAGTVTDGIVSAINRAVEVPAGNGYTKRMTLMQTNAAINPGNSGGPLINNKGEVVGINTLKLTEEYEGIGFSIPINSAVSIFNQLISDGHVTNYDQSFVTGNGSIGISAVDVTEEESKFYGIPVGILVKQVKPGSSASAAGLRRGDIITAFNGTKTATVNELNELKSEFKAGDEVTLTVYRDPDQYVDITFKLDVMG